MYPVESDLLYPTYGGLKRTDSVEDCADRLMRRAVNQLNTTIDMMGSGVLGTIHSAKGDRLFIETRFFYAGQRIQFYAAGGGLTRGERTVLKVKERYLVLDSDVPDGTVAGDLILLAETAIAQSWLYNNSPLISERPMRVPEGLTRV